MTPPLTPEERELVESRRMGCLVNNYDPTLALLDKLLARIARLEAVRAAAEDARCCVDSDMDGHTCGRDDLLAALAAVKGTP